MGAFDFMSDVPQSVHDQRKLYYYLKLKAVSSGRSFTEPALSHLDQIIVGLPIADGFGCWESAMSELFPGPYERELHTMAEIQAYTECVIEASAVLIQLCAYSSKGTNSWLCLNFSFSSPSLIA